ncbi:GNAT family N-acetyltransferase [Nitratireductor sp. GISD-1A_MAKvit]|uniref:GNAT family N-acetyltransferase n=1 Tax=Nitratireductor sp. GISD-1A_MAKvit TaxID=3234198 RepID=UPI003466B9B3
MTFAKQPDPAPGSSHHLHDGLHVEVCAADASAIERYRSDSLHAGFMPAQSPDWISAWARHMREAPIIARLADAHGHLMSLVLETARQGPFVTARFVGDRHANGNFPLLDRRVRDGLSPQHLDMLREGIRRVRPDIDLLALERQLRCLGDQTNPLLAWPHGDSPNVSLAVDLDGGFDAVLARASGKRKRKQHRSQARKLEAAGGYRRIRAATPEEAASMLDAFFEMKAHRFARMGIHDVFAPHHVRSAFHALFGEATAEPDPKFVLHGLEVAGKLRAITGSSRAGSRIICEFSSISDDELTEASPGRFLFYQNIEEACAEGLELYDFSVGDEYYKRLWCDVETIQFDTFVPMTLKGKSLAGATSGFARLKRLINGSPRLWSLVKTARRSTSWLRR